MPKKKQQKMNSLVVARKNAKHSQIKAAAAIDCSQGIIVAIETRDEWPKSPHLVKAIHDYINEHGGNNG